MSTISRIYRYLLFATLMMALAGLLAAQDPNAGRVLGAVTNINAEARQLTLKTDAGTEVAVTMDGRATYRRVAPGETNLANAATIAITDIKVGDRVLARGKSGEDQKTLSALQVIVMSQSEIASKQAADRVDWDRRGAQGVVTDVKPDQITINVRTLQGATPLIIKTAPNAAVRRYAPDSVKFADAKPSALAEIKKGDQVRARGNKSTDGMSMTAEEVVSGQFAMTAGLILSVDAKENIVRINNITTKKPMTVRISTDSSVKKLPAPLAQVIANRLHGVEDAAGPGGRGAGPASGAPAGAVAGGAISSGTGAGGPGGRGEFAGRGGGPGAGAGGFGTGRGGGRGPGDLQQMLDRTPSIAISDLMTGEAIIVSSTIGTSADQITAISLLAGVEPILTKPGTRELSLGGGGDFGGGGDLGGLGGGFGQ